MENKHIDHLFRHHSGKMVAVLTRIFGLSNLEIIEDSIQDTFLKASISWKTTTPDNPEAWLTQAAKNRVLDIFRKLKNEKKHTPELSHGAQTIAFNDFFLETEIDDAQLRMIFTACHPKLNAKDQIAFSLKTISGFNTKEIAAALLTKEDSIKKRLLRAKKFITSSSIQFTIPQGLDLRKRIEQVLEVLYLIFNEGFHSNNTNTLIRKELCGEALRLCKLLLKNKYTNIPSAYALFALMCFHAARLESKTTDENEILDLKHQDRSRWSYPLIQLGNAMMHKAVENDERSCYHYEAAIAAEHIKAASFELTNWKKILYWYECLHELKPSPYYLLNMAVVCLQDDNYMKANFYFEKINIKELEQRSYLYYGAKSDYYSQTNQHDKAIEYLNFAIEKVNNKLEKNYLLKKKQILLQQN
ncbi:RNA polymerase sigma-70 factor, ECF subfamily [Tenacibaculum sp. MAR_2009_124]|uniref:RNA polymerase sigma factor n=1 Tax=Tenacibaculum sp. MAR_2009_124 TaxID=1250059 RepID=UPI000899A471|nr:sigma-70 family RNA polymerase sigma factor [Tenacibaculum sp. MAR_2009_124]SEC17267.1 RNA polymerase sigma-70 factor, ECF subfamily [Tenacibaculum sp. MAR_2009_124]